MSDTYNIYLLELSKKLFREKQTQDHKHHDDFDAKKDHLRMQIAFEMDNLDKIANLDKMANSDRSEKTSGAFSLQWFKRQMLWVVAFAGIVSTTLLGINLGLFAGSLTPLGWGLLVPMLLVALYFYYKMYKLDDVHDLAGRADAFWHEQWSEATKDNKPNDNDYHLAMASVLVCFVTVCLVLAPNLVLASPYVFVIAMVMVMLMADWVCTRMFPTVAFRIERDFAALDFAESFWQDLQNQNGAFRHLNKNQIKALKSSYTKFEAFYDVMVLLTDQEKQGKEDNKKNPKLYLYARLNALMADKKSEEKLNVQSSVNENAISAFIGCVVRSVQAKKDARKSWGVWFADFFGTVNGIVVNPLIMVATTFVGLNALISLLMGSAVQVLPVALVGLPVWAGLLLVLVACAGAYSSTKVTRRSIIKGVESVLKSRYQDEGLGARKWLNAIFTSIMTMGMVLLTWLMMQKILLSWGIVGLAGLGINVFVCLLTTLAVGLLMGKSGIAFMRLFDQVVERRQQAIKFMGLATLTIVAAGIVAACVMIYGLGMAISLSAQVVILAMMVALVVAAGSYKCYNKNVSLNFMIKLSGGIFASMVASLAVVQFGVLLSLPLTLTMWATGLVAICSLPLNFAMFSVLGGVFDKATERAVNSSNVVKYAPVPSTLKSGLRQLYPTPQCPGETPRKENLDVKPQRT